MIISSLLDTDLYKLTLMQVVLHQFPAVEVEYKFKCHNADIDPDSGQATRALSAHVTEIREEIRSLCSLHFQDAELAYLRTLRFIKSDFVDFLGFFTLSEQYVAVTALPTGEIDITIKGPWLHTLLFEIPVLAIVSEVYARNRPSKPSLEIGRERLQAKIDQLHTAKLSELKIADYGTRRRFSASWHEEVLQRLKARLGTGMTGQLAGTSNVLLAMKLGLTPLGTMAHEYLQACQALGPSLRGSQKYALESWTQEYRGDLGIALSGVYGMNAFVRDFDLYFCKLFDGVRHDGGDPFVWAQSMLDHYARNRIDPRTKTLVFSDELTVPKIIAIYQQFKGRSQLAFGIGTNLTNDLGEPAGDEPLQIAIKMVHCNGQPVANLLDRPGNNVCEDGIYLAYLRQIFDVPQSA